MEPPTRGLTINVGRDAMATENRTTQRPLTPGQIEMETLRERAESLEHYFDIHSAIEGPVMEALCMADLAMTWWEHVRDERAQLAAVTKTTPHFTDRDLAIASFAFGDLWSRLRIIDDHVAQDQKGAG